VVTAPKLPTLSYSTTLSVNHFLELGFECHTSTCGCPGAPPSMLMGGHLAHCSGGSSLITSPLCLTRDTCGACGGVVCASSTLTLQSAYDKDGPASVSSLSLVPVIAVEEENTLSRNARVLESAESPTPAPSPPRALGGATMAWLAVGFVLTCMCSWLCGACWAFFFLDKWVKRVGARFGLSADSDSASGGCDDNTARPKGEQRRGGGVSALPSTPAPWSPPTSHTSITIDRPPTPLSSSSSSSYRHHNHHHKYQHEENKEEGPPSGNFGKHAAPPSFSNPPPYAQTPPPPYTRHHHYHHSGSFEEPSIVVTLAETCNYALEDEGSPRALLAAAPTATTSAAEAEAIAGGEICNTSESLERAGGGGGSRVLLCGMVGGEVLYDFDAQEPWQLSVRQGDQVELVRDEGDGWLTIEAAGNADDDDDGGGGGGGGDDPGQTSFSKRERSPGAQGQIPSSYLSISNATGGAFNNVAAQSPTASEEAVSEVGLFVRELGLGKFVCTELERRSAGGGVQGLKDGDRCSDAQLVREVGLSKFEVRKLRAAVDAYAANQGRV